VFGVGGLGKGSVFELLENVMMVPACGDRKENKNVTRGEDALEKRKGGRTESLPRERLKIALQRDGKDIEV